MIEYRIKKGEIIISAFLNKSDRNVIFAAGLPQSIDKNHPLVKQAEAIGFNLFIPHYPGTHDSSGKFSVRNSVAAIEKTIELVKSGSATELYNQSIINWDATNIFLIGFSFGGLIALLQESIVDKTILICPFVLVDYHLGDKNYFSENIVDTFDFINRAYAKTYRFDSKDLVDELKTITLPETKSNLIVIAKKEDTSIPAQEITFLKKRYNCRADKLPGSHSSSISDDYLRGLLV